MAADEIGRVAAIHRYPVKSMRGEAMASAALGWNGIEGDRQYAFYRAGDGSRFPWLTGRDIADLVRHAATYADPADPRRSPVWVTAPDGAEFDLRAPALAARLAAACGEEVRLLQLGRGTFDSMPVSVVTGAMFRALGEAFGGPLDAARFRINLILDSEAREEEWLGRTLIFGEGDAAVRLRVNRPIPRCRMITIDPATAERDPAVLRLVAERFGNMVGAYCAPDRPGTVRAGDRVRLT